MAHALHRGGDGLPVDDAAGAEGDRQAEALGRQRLENLQLNLPHELDVDLPQPLVPHEVELGILLLQQEELAQGGVGILPLGEEHLVDEHRLQGGGRASRLCPKALPGGGAAQAGDGHHASRLGLVHGLEPGPRVDAQLIRLLPSSRGRRGPPFTRRAPPVSFIHVRRFPWLSREILNTRAAKSGPYRGRGAYATSPWRNSATPSSFRAEPNQQGKSLRRAIRAVRVSPSSAPSSR